MNILVTALGSVGDVQPMVAIGKRLLDRGHQVTILTTPYYANNVRPTGIPLIPLGDVEQFKATLAHADLWHPLRGPRILVREVIGPAMRLAYDAIRQWESSDSLVVAHSLDFGARIAHETLRVPLVTVHPYPVVLRSAHVPPVLGPVEPAEWLPKAISRFRFWMADRLLVAPTLGRIINTFRDELGLPRVASPMGDWWHSPQQTIGLFPDWYAPRQPDWPSQLRLTGFPMWQWSRGELACDLEKFLFAGDAPITFTAGTAMEHGKSFFAAAVEACRLSGRRGLLLTTCADQIPADLPDGVQHCEFAPFDELLPRCAAVVHHGGIGTTAHALAAGIPQLVVPFAFDQHDNAARVRRLGVAEKIRPSRFRGATAAAALARLLESADVRKSCQQYAERLRDVDALGETCDLIERVPRRITFDKPVKLRLYS